MNSKYNGYDFIENNLLNNCHPNHFNGKTIADFKIWKADMTEKILKLFGLDKMIAANGTNEFIEKEVKEKYAVEKYVIDTLVNLKMPYYKLTPFDNNNNKAVIVIHGHGCNGKEGLVNREIDLFNDDIKKYNYTYVYELLQKGYTVYVPDLLPAGERILGIYNDKTSECTDVNNALISMGMCLQGIIFYELRKLLDNIIDSYDKVGCCGFSGGGNCALWLAALDKRIGFSLVSGYLHSFKDVLLYTNRCGCNFVPGLWEIADMGDILAMAAPTDVYLETGRYDKLNGIRGVEGVLEQLEIANRAYAVFDKKLDINICEGKHQWYGSILDKI